MLSKIGTIGVVGAGQMGIGIAQIAAQYLKKPVFLYDANHQALEQNIQFMHKLLDKNVQKGKMTSEDRDATIGKIRKVERLEDLKDCHFIVEAVKEDLEIKQKLFKRLSDLVFSDKTSERDCETVLATNTSSISVTKIAAQTARPDRVIGMHFMNPVPVMKLVEVIPGLATSEETLTITLQLATAMQKTTTVSKDMPGFIANRCLMPYINEAIFTLSEGIGSKEDIDTTMKLGCHMPMGPLALADFIGLDTCLSIMQVLHHQLGDSKYRPCPLLIQYVDAGRLGKKSNRGFYDYD